MRLETIPVDNSVPLSVLEMFFQDIVGWPQGSFSVVRVSFSDNEPPVTKLDYPTDFSSTRVWEIIRDNADNFNKMNEYFNCTDINKILT